MSKINRLLLIDDDPGICEMLPLIFDTEQFFIKTIGNHLNLRNKIIDFNPEIILLDIMFCGLDGREICRALKIDDVTKAIPIVLISAAIVDSTENFGQDLVISKPFDITFLENEVIRILNSK